MKRQEFLFGVLCLFAASSTAIALESDSKSTTTTTTTTATAVDSWEQTASASDRAIVDKIRKALADNSALSPKTKDIKIFSTNGNVTLRGTVANDKERRDIENIAEQVTGVISINNKIEVK